MIPRATKAPTHQHQLNEEGGIADKHYRYGEIVRCQNLTSDAGQKFNGAVAIIDTWDRETDSYSVKGVYSKYGLVELIGSAPYRLMMATLRRVVFSFGFFF